MTRRDGGRSGMNSPARTVRHPSGAMLVVATPCSVMLCSQLCRAQNPPAKEPAVRTPVEVEALIRQMGTTPPDWWDSVKLSYPPTLDLDWPLKPGGQWDARRNVGQYIWDVINPNPGRWREGIKLVHYLMIRHKDDRDKLGHSPAACRRRVRNGWTRGEHATGAFRDRTEAAAKGPPRLVFPAAGASHLPVGFPDPVLLRVLALWIETIR